MARTTLHRRRVPPLFLLQKRNLQAHSLEITQSRLQHPRRRPRATQHLMHKTLHRRTVCDPIIHARRTPARVLPMISDRTGVVPQSGLVHVRRGERGRVWRNGGRRELRVSHAQRSGRMRVRVERRRGGSDESRVGKRLDVERGGNVIGMPDIAKRFDSLICCQKKEDEAK